MNPVDIQNGSERFFVKTPVGHVAACLREGKLVELAFVAPARDEDVVWCPGGECALSQSAQLLAQELHSYFSGNGKDFSVEIDFSAGLGPFERRVLRELMKVPYGMTISYQGLAQRCGSPRGARAVGNAMRKNPIPVVVPCHRVINADGTMGRYSGGEGVKPFLLKLEKGQS